MKRPRLHLSRRVGSALVLTCAVASTLAPAAVGDDRDLLRANTGKPYVFILLDSSESTQGAIGDSPTGPFSPAWLDDDPDSKLYLMKQSIFTLLDRSREIQFGFATLPNQDGLSVDGFSCDGHCVDRAGGGGFSANCSGWEPNGDDLRDSFGQGSLKWPTTGDPATGLDHGDLVPLSWNDDNAERIKQRVAPNLAIGGTSPDFGIRHYFGESPAGTPIPLLDSNARPLIARGEAGLAAALDDFRRWVETWRPLAERQDPDLATGCTPVFLVLLTDGFESCGRDPVEAARLVHQNAGIPVFVVGFAAENPILEQMAQAGGTCAVRDEASGACLQHAFSPGTGEEVAEAMRAIQQQVRAQAAQFTSPTVSQPAAGDGNRIFLPAFVPASGSAYWPGRLDAFLPPLPLAGGEPDRTRRCAGGESSGCLLWDAGEETLAQVNPPNLLGNGPDQRRVFYARQGEPGAWPQRRRMLAPPPEGDDAPSVAARYDLWRALGLIDGTVADGSLGAEREAEHRARTAAVIDRTLEAKSVTVSPPEGGERRIEFILGDIFHSTPLVVSRPPDTRLFAADAGFGQSSDAGDCASGRDRGYRCYFARHERRRQVVLAGANDGLLHAFDAGVFRRSGTDVKTGASLSDAYDTGRGRELWAYMPRSAMPTVARLAVNDEHDWGVDGPVAAADAFIDPLFDRRSGPRPASREWRTVLVGGLREGGRGYYALDITQPDPLVSLPGAPGAFMPDIGRMAGGWVPSCLGEPLTAESTPAAGCGPVPYPAPLWEFDDSLPRPPDAGNGLPAGLPVTVDESRNGLGDLGDTWSRPGLGRILVCREGGSRCNPTDPENANPYDPASPGDLVVKSVAVFGGGMDVEAKTDARASRRGDWLYMVDLETGQALYKRRLVGAAPAEPAVVDTTADGFLDRIYIPTIAGLVYRVDLIPDAATGNLPALTSAAVGTVECDPADMDCPRQLRVDRGWDPVVVFDATGADGGIRPFYMRPTVFFVSAVRRFAVALGTGDREDLWSRNGQAGRFYVFVDRHDPRTGDPAPGPLREASLAEVAIGGVPNGAAPNTLLAPPPGHDSGWFFAFDPDERVTTGAFALSGVLSFSTFNPAEVRGQASCRVGGESRVFAVNTASGSGLLRPPAEGAPAAQFQVVEQLVTEPFAEMTTGLDPSVEVPDLPEEMIPVFEGLQDLFPPNCRFANHRIDVKMISTTRQLELIAPVPVCIVEKNWREF